MLSLTDPQSSPHTRRTSQGSSPPSATLEHGKSSITTKPSEARSDAATPCVSMTSTASTTSTPCISLPLPLAPMPSLPPAISTAEPPEIVAPRFAAGSMRTDALPAPVASAMPAQHAEASTDLPPAVRNLLPQLETNANRRPRLFRGFLWEDNGSFVTPLADLSETLRPLPSPPPSAYEDREALRTIALHPELFRIVTPINVDRFEYYLQSHPNRPLVDSVLRGLREGFWPFADLEGFPSLWDEELKHPLSDDVLNFVESYAKQEEDAGRYSHPFGPDLMPGMYSMPVHAVPKSNSDKLRLINNHSAGRWALNAMIDKNNIGMRPDNVQDLAANLLRVRREHGDIPVWLFKSDIKNAYRLLPMHPLWQLKQVVTTGPPEHRVRRIDRNLCFGSRGSPDIFLTVQSLALWIAVYRVKIVGQQGYMDDSFNIDLASELAWYAPYQRHMPPKQVRLLLLWDELGIPHSDEKQLFGRQLTIIGFHIDPVRMTISLPHDKRLELVRAIRDFLDAPKRRRTVREWQRILGWINWGLNIQPLLRPALQSSYAKLRGRVHSHAPVYINKSVRRDLTWVAQQLETTSGICMLYASVWGPQSAALTIFCDASLSGLGFWCPQMNVGFMSDLPLAPPRLTSVIFWFEALTVISALDWVSSLPRGASPLRLAIYSDNLNTVQIFDSLRADDEYVALLLHACSLLIHASPPIDLRVWHVPGEQNIVADALSRGMLHVARQYAPTLQVYTFIPPQISLEGDAPI